MSNPDIVVVGSCNIDFTFFTKKIPKRGETAYGTKFISGFGGKGANQCIAAAKLGVSTAMVARLGDDHFGKEYFELMKRLNVDTTHVTLSEGISSGVAEITVSETDGDNYILIIEGANGLLSPNDVEKATDVIQNAKIGLFQCEVSVNTTIAAMKLFKEKSKAILFLNPSPASENLDPIMFKLVDVLVLNETETEILTKKIVKSVEDACGAIKYTLELGCSTVIITLGCLGAVFATKEEPRPIHVKVEPVNNPVDPTGAGDLFLGALAYAYIQKHGSKLSDKVQFACNVARECVKKPGAQESFPYKKDILHLIN